MAPHKYSVSGQTKVLELTRSFFLKKIIGSLANISGGAAIEGAVSNFWKK